MNLISEYVVGVVYKIDFSFIRIFGFFIFWFSKRLILIFGIILILLILSFEIK